MDSAFSLFADLQTSQQFKDQAQYYYAELALFFGLNSEFKTKMTQVMKNSSETSLKKQAVESLVQNAGAIDSNDVPGLETEITKWQVKTNSDAFLLKKAKYHASQGDLASAEESLNQIGPNSKLIVESKILQSTVDYRLGDLNAAIKHLESAVPKLASDRTDKLRNLTYLTLGRLYFQKGLYKQSYAQYLLIDKGSGFWLQSTTEQALTQIMAGDYIGAAGNMFSLHTEYFKKAYAPESYIIRAIGYLNLCQFGDSVSVVAELQKRYTPYIDKIQNFETNNKNSADYYNLVRELFNKNDQAEVNGVAKAFIIELARHPSFVSIQKKINSLEDELAQFNTVSNGLTGKANSIRQSITQTKNMITDFKNKKMNDLQIEQLQRKELVLETDLLIAQTGREKIEKMKAQASERIASEKTKLKQLAGEALQKRYILSRKELVDVLDQKDVLAYEIYSGAGEHLRYQMAGGETKERAPATALTPEEKQSYKWKFRGEVWEDEIGHYRSSLTNVCPKEIAKIAGDK
ncbi:MAG: tetratricopeptide repeat protein [Pseudobdellovibrio sp.]